MFSFSLISQIKLIYPGQDTDISNTLVTESVSISEEKLIFDIWVVNNSPNPKKIVCQRVEENAVVGTENQTCWVICPPTKNKAGEGFNPFFVSAGMDMTVENLAVGDTSKSFSFKYYLNETDGCSSYKFNWYNEDDLNTVLATIDLDIIHSSTGDCTVGIEDLEETKVSFSPNPSNGLIKLKFSNSNAYNVKVVDLLGKTVLSQSRFSNEMIDLSSEKKGIYFIIVSDDLGRKISTQKLILE